MIAGIILAAGASSRMGRPKALLDYRGETFLGRLIRVLGTSCDPVIVVLGYHADLIRQHGLDPDRMIAHLQPLFQRFAVSPKTPIKQACSSACK